jgi:3-phenylpropionate/trans-cinnamate dioxygenase ferredoxin subunit
MSEFKTVARLSAIPDGKSLAVNVDGNPIALWHVHGTVYAIGDICSHEEAYLSEGDLVGDCCVSCPAHGAEFDLRTGTALCLPAVTPVPTYPVRIVGDEIQVAIT